MSRGVEERVPLAPLTTFTIGGSATQFLEIHTEEELISAAREGRADSFAILGGGSNLLVPDAGIDGLVLKISLPGIVFEDIDAHTVRVVAGAGVSWEDLVHAAGEQSLWGIENLAGIPGTVGGAAVQNIGAYGAELEQVFEYADAFDLATGERRRIERALAGFAYRDSIFKRERALVIMRVALRLGREGNPNLAYKDLHAAAERALLTSPLEIAAAVRAIRAGKFPNLAEEGTAGSFFKNPILAREFAAALAAKYPALPQFPQADGRVKISLAWLLDHALNLKGSSAGAARLFERQPLVIAAAHGARSEDVEQLAQFVERKVFAETGIKIEREVETFSARKLSTARA